MFFAAFPAVLAAWPTTSQWVPVYKNGALLQDPNGDTNGARNIVSDPANDAAFLYNDGSYLHFRLRLDQTPAGTGGQGLLKAFGWGLVIDTNGNPADYEWLLMVDGLSQSENIALWRNSAQGTLGSPSDAPETLLSQLALLNNFQVNAADTSFNGDQDYFLDFRFPYSTFKTATGLGDYASLRMFFGSSSNASRMTENGGDLVGGTDLYNGLSDPAPLNGTTGTVRFVNDLAGAGDMLQLIAGGTAYLRVDDLDQNSSPTTVQTVRVTVSAPSGDSESLTLAETGVNTGVFTGRIVTAAAAPPSADGVLQTMPGETVLASYVDAMDAGFVMNQVRQDSLLIPPPALAISKSVTPASVVSGSTVAYTITLTNSGDGDAWVNLVQDILPAGFAYATGTTSGLTTSTPVINGQAVEWRGNWTVPRKTGGVDGSRTLSFKAYAVGPNGTHFNSASASGGNFSLVSVGNTAGVTISAPLLVLSKTVDVSTAAPGATLTYCASYRNLGNGPARSLVIIDSVPENTLYKAGSLRLGAAGASYAASAPLTDAAGDDAGTSDGATVVFTLSDVAPGGEGRAYFQVVVK